ncbi:hypothetical protein PV325_002236 [Microctonus aethiopoides]|nr:hypothetical protein PV325_002236 [Microctonus aethiopoides]KAK0098587.1 hypothetical protein PV326_006595 [Microctonus aethiopoides]
MEVEFTSDVDRNNAWITSDDYSRINNVIEMKERRPEEREMMKLFGCRWSFWNFAMGLASGNHHRIPVSEVLESHQMRKKKNYERGKEGDREKEWVNIRVCEANSELKLKCNKIVVSVL